MGDLTDGNPMEFEVSSEVLGEKGVVMEFKRVRVFERRELGDEDNIASSVIFLPGL